MRRKLILRVISASLALLMAVPSSTINVFAATPATNSTYNELFHTVASQGNGLTSASYELQSSGGAQDTDNTTPGGGPSPEATQAPESTPVPEVPQSPEVTQTPDNPAGSDATPSPETTPVPDVSTNPEATPTVDAILSPEITPDATLSPAVSQSPDELISPVVSPSPDALLSPIVTPSSDSFALTQNSYINLSVAELKSEYEELYGRWITSIRYNYTIANGIFDSYSGIKLVLMGSHKTFSATDTEINDSDWVPVYTSGTYINACDNCYGSHSFELPVYTDPTDPAKVTLQGYKTYMLRAIGTPKSDESTTTVLAESALFDASKHSYSEVYDNDTNFKGMILSLIHI